MLSKSLCFAVSALLVLSACASSPEAQSVPPGLNAQASDRASGNAFSENPERWKLLADTNGVRIYQDLEAIPGRIGLRGRSSVNASIAKVATALTDLEIRKKWLGILVEAKIIRVTSDFERVEYAKLKTDWPYQYTDFVYKMTFSVLREPRTLLIRMKSIDDASVPVPADTARGEVTGSYNFVREIDPDHSELVLEMGVDPKGALPSWDSQTKVVAWFNQTMQSLRATVEAPSLKVSPSVQQYMAKYKL